MRRHHPHVFTALSWAAALGCGGSSPGSHSDPLPQGPSLPLIVVDQTLDDLSTVVRVASVETEVDAWIAVGTPADAPAAFLGWRSIAPGTSTELTVALERPVVDGETLVTYLLDDATATGTFDGVAIDVTQVTGEGDAVIVPFVVTVPASTPAVRFHLAYERSTGSWSFGAVEPGRFASWVEPFVDNPGLTLVGGWRYSFVNAVSSDDPLELVAVQSANTDDDVVLLSQGTAGAAEADAAVLWDESASDEARLTLAPSLAPLLNGYRSAARPTMRGLIYVVSTPP